MDYVTRAGFSYACHATVACGLAWLACRWLPAPRHRAQLWLLALLIPFATVAVQFAVPGNLWALGAKDAVRMTSIPSPGPVTMTTSAGRVQARIDASGPPIALAPSTRLHQAARLAAAIWLAGIAICALRLATAFAWHRRRLGRRQRVDDPWIDATADGFALSIGERRVPVTVSANIETPTALSGDVCLPPRALTELPRAELAAVLAHEIAHIRRRDPAAILLVEIVRAIAWFHPAVLQSARAWRREIEYACDDLATASVDVLSLAKAMGTVAAWSVRATTGLRPATMSSGEFMHLRVERLLAPRAGGVSTPKLGVAVIALLMAVACLALPSLRLEPSQIEIRTDGAVLRMQRR